MKVKSYKDLNVWKKGISIVDMVYQMTDSFPPEERYGLAGQMQRSAVSIPTNIAEGFSRQHFKEYKQFLHISLGSCAELDTQAIVAQRRNYLSTNTHQQLAEHLNHESRMLMNLIKCLGR